MNKLVAGSIAIALFLLAGCVASGPKLASSAEDIVGTWQSTIHRGEVQLNEDGTWRSQDPDGGVDTGEFWFEGTRYFDKASPRSGCTLIGAQIGIYEVELLESGNLKWILIEDECLTRVNYFAGRLIEVEFEPVP